MIGEKFVKKAVSGVVLILETSKFPSIVTCCASPGLLNIALSVGLLGNPNGLQFAGLDQLPDAGMKV